MVGLQLKGRVLYSQSEGELSTASHQGHRHLRRWHGLYSFAAMIVLAASTY
jgi:hypothetical protein